MHPRIRNGFASAFLASCLALPARAQQPDAHRRPPAGGQRRVESPGNAQWAQTVEEARGRAASEKKLVFFEFDGASCGECQRMQALLYPAFDFEALLIGMVPVKVRHDSPEARPLQERYGVGKAPSVLITTPEGRLVFLMEGFQNAPDFYRHVHQDLDRYRKFARKIDTQEVATLSAEEALSTGRELYARRDPQEALPRLKRASVAPDPGAGVREAALEGLAAVEFELGDPAASRRSIERLIAIARDPDQKERAELFRAQIPLSQNQPAEALALYKKFAREHPDSKYLERVQSFIARLESAPSAP